MSKTNVFSLLSKLFRTTEKTKPELQVLQVVQLSLQSFSFLESWWQESDFFSPFSQQSEFDFWASQQELCANWTLKFCFGNTKIPKQKIININCSFLSIALQNYEIYINHKRHKDFTKHKIQLMKPNLCDLKNIRTSRNPCALCVKKLVNLLCLLWFKKLFLSFYESFSSS